MEKKNGPVRALQILFMAMLYGQILFALLSFILVKYGFFKQVNFQLKTEKIFETLSVIISFVAVLLAFSVFKKKIEQARKNVALKEKFTEYRTACIIKYAMIEAASLLSIIFYLLTSKWNFIVIAVLLIFIFMSQNPIRQRIKTELMVDDTDVEEMNKSE